MTKLGARTGLILAALLALAGCVRPPLASVPAAERQAIAASLMRDITILSGDDFGGRLPGTDGEQRTLAFIIEEMQRAGLESGTNDPGNVWRAPVPLVSTTPQGSSIKLSYGATEGEVPVEAGVAYTSLRRALVEGADVVFVGKEGETVAAEAVAGKVVLMLGEPGVGSARREALFEKNPAAIITVVEDEAAIAQLRQFQERERFILASEETTALSAFVTRGIMRGGLGEKRWSELLAAAEEPNFKPIDLTVAATIEANSRRREFNSYNVIGQLPGRIPGSGAVLLLAHWDHLGECGPEEAEDRICNGAVDNASGIAVMLELAKRLSATGLYDRDIYFMATSAEEAGLLGIRAFVETPAFPLDSIVAAFNFDSVAVAPAGKPVGFVGEGRTPLDDMVRQVLSDGKRKLGDRALAEKYLQRQDNWVLLQEGVPAIMLSTAFGSKISLGPYLEQRYHRANDESDNVELGGAIDDLLLHEELVRRVADTTRYKPPPE